MRRGTVTRQNALRPTPDAAPELVIQVSINGKTATAHGPSFEHMRRAGSPQQLEQESENPIEWEASLAGLPRTIQIVADEGSEVIARLRFEQCAAPAKAKRRGGQPAKAQAPKSAPKPKAASETNHPIPQGAIQ